METVHAEYLAAKKYSPSTSIFEIVTALIKVVFSTNPKCLMQNPQSQKARSK